MNDHKGIFFCINTGDLCRVSIQLINCKKKVNHHSNPLAKFGRFRKSNHNGKCRVEIKKEVCLLILYEREIVKLTLFLNFTN